MKRACPRLRCSLLALPVVLLASVALAQVNINSSPNAVGSGARALGMGGAFIAVADDATAASWNPGGLTQLERPELSIVYSWKYGEEDFDSESHPELNGSHDVDFDSLNYLSFVYPFKHTIAGRNLVLSLNYQRKFDFDRALDVYFHDITPLPFGFLFDLGTRVKYRQGGSLSAISPALGFELTNRLSVGVVANIWDESLLPSNEWKERTEFKTRFSINGVIPSFVWGEIVEDYKDFEGTNYTFGLLYRPTQRLSVGAVYHTKFAADVKYTRYFRLRGGVPFFTSAYREEDRRIEYPSAIGVGLAYRFPNDKLTLSLDVTRREWDEFVEVDRTGRRTSPITGLRKNVSFHEPTYTVRLGGEYVFVDANRPKQNYLPSLRAGLIYDPEPAGGRPDRWFGLGQGDGETEKYYGVTLGAGVLIKNRVNIDAAYEYRWGDDVRKDSFSLFGTDADVEQHQFYLSTVVYF
ncbi:MAG: outer membrane protein transport protein [Candidatus Hydrogenedentes bacterium]|nr:outer membrane protein transport protein [Candidatus Hydrogenedentota bacterium]